MKTGIIVYVISNNQSNDDFDMKEAVKALDITADKVEFVFSGEKHFDIMDAWWKLTRIGMKQIVCMIGEIVSTSKVRLTGRELQLCGA
ncbi:conserved hypothetical protein [Candidatus Magnetomoraceae bacterium gMMP-15]